MWKLLAAGAVAVAAAAGGYAYAQDRARHEMEAGLTAFRSSLPPGSAFTYASAQPRLFSRSAHLADVRVAANGLVFTAAEADVAPDGEGRLRRLALRDAAETGPATKLALGSVDCDNLSVPAGTGDGRGIDPKALTADHVDLRDVRFTSEGSGAMTVAQLLVDGYGAGRLGRAEVRTVSLTPPDQSFDSLTLQRLQMSGVDLTRLWPPYGEPAPVPPGSTEALEASGLTLTAHSRPLVTVAAVDATANAQGADKLGTHAAVRDLVVLGDDTVTPGLLKLGYDRFQGSMAVDGELDEAARQLRLDQLDVDAPGMGHARFAVTLDNLPPGLLDQGAGRWLATQASPFAFLGTHLMSLAFSYEDQSLVRKLTAAAAAAQGTSAAGVTEAAQAQVGALAEEAGLPETLVAPVQSFLADPHRLSIAMNPPEPVAVLGLMSLMRDDPERSLGLRVTN